MQWLCYLLSTLPSIRFLQPEAREPGIGRAGRLTP